MFWGFSESLDLVAEYLKAFKDLQGASSFPESKFEQYANAANHGSFNSRRPVLNILLFGTGDTRHVIQTIAKLYTHAEGGDGSRTPLLNFFIVEGLVEVVARSLALLGIALESADSLSLRSKVHLFMDVYGNSLVRPTSHHYLVAKSKVLLKMLGDPEEMQRMAPILSIDAMKYRERDGLERCFQFWVPSEDHVFEITEYWNARVRHLLGSRYDSREGAYDWDLNMTLKDRNAEQICSQEYRYWRETGIAFTYPEHEQCKANKTLSAGLLKNGSKFLHRGYVGDIQTGPFCTFGLRSSDESFSHSVHGTNDYRATDVVERNLYELFHEIKERKPYQHDNDLSRKYGAVKLQMAKRFKWEDYNLELLQTYDQPWLPVPGVKVNVMSMDEVLTIQQDATGRWNQFFDIVFIGHNYFPFIKPSFSKIFRPKALLIMETKLLTLVRKDQLNEFQSKLNEFAKSAGMESIYNYNALNLKFSMLKFRKGFEPDNEMMVD